MNLSLITTSVTARTIIADRPRFDIRFTTPTPDTHPRTWAGLGNQA